MVGSYCCSRMWVSIGVQILHSQDMLKLAGKRTVEGPLDLGHIAWEHLALLDSVGMNFLCEVVCQLIAVDVDDFRRHED